MRDRKAKVGRRQLKRVASLRRVLALVGGHRRVSGGLARGKSEIGVKEQRAAIDGLRVRRDGARAVCVALYELAKGAEGRVVAPHHWQNTHLLLLDPATWELVDAARTKAATRKV